MTIIKDLDERGNVFESFTARVHIEMWEYCIKINQQPNATTNYKRFKIRMFGNYESSFTSSWDNDPLSCLILS